MNILDSSCTITHYRATEGILSGVVIYGPSCRPAFLDNEVCRNRESGVFVFAGACPRMADNWCFDNHHFGLAMRDPGTRPDFVRNLCRDNMLSGVLLFHLCCSPRSGQYLSGQSALGIGNDAGVLADPGW